MKKYRKKTSGDVVTLKTPKMVERFFENRDPNEWEEVT
jgi:hypothetical protein